MAENPYIGNPPAKFEPPESLSRKEAENQMHELEEAVEYHNVQYYIKNNPRISDAAFDRLFHRLQELESEFPDLASESSPTQRIGTVPVDALKKVKHESIMLSLDSALENEKIRDFHRHIQASGDWGKPLYVLEPKWDGLSIEVVYEQGEFMRDTTRGDGRTGEDITKNIKTIQTLPLRLQSDVNLPSFIAVRGEVLLSKSGFQDVYRRRVEENQASFANPRNAVAGIVRQLDSRQVADKPLTIFFYEVLRIEDGQFASHWDKLNRLQEWGLRTHNLNQHGSTFDEIEDYRQKLSDQREDLDFEIDGIVIKLNHLQGRNTLGKRQCSPRWAMAWKFPPKKEVTRLKDIVVQVGRTGILTPVALLEPVHVGGVTVSRATLHNEEEVQKKDVRPEDKVRVIRAGDVIPEIHSRIKEPGKKRTKHFSMPAKCPVCQTKLVREGAYTLCPAGLSCKAQLKGRLEHYASRSAVNIDTLGDKVAQQLVERGMVHSLPDLYTLSVEEFESLEGFAKKSAQKLFDAIHENKTLSLDIFLCALGIRHVGEHIARVAARAFGDLDSLAQASVSDLERIDEIEPEIAESIVHFFQEKENQKILKRFEKLGVHVKPVSQPSKKTLSGKTFVFTGALSRYTRKKAQQAVESLGGRAASSVSGQTDYVVAGEDPGSKLDKAKEEGVEILDESDFKKLLK
ncbi:NAD-dependent DNA ligase LigA [bacterium]|nr:NAD-dependent DNA ligase LigA [bacterium]